MAKPTSWIPHVETFVDSSRPSNQQAASLEAIVALVKNDLLTIEALVKEMEMYLSTSDHVLRARGILLLAELLSHLISKPLDNATIHSLTGFFTSRLADWQALRGALVGCLALLRRSNKVGMVTITDARLLTESYLQNLQVQSLAAHDRRLCFELLECLLERYADAVAPLGDEFIYGICEAIDEEKDPRCLLLTFHIVEILVRVFNDPMGPISTFASDIFDILSRYFPIYFTHPKNDDLDVKRNDLSKALMHAFASTPLFEPFVIPLLLEKLSSSLLSAKLDSLKYLSHCTLHYGADRMAKHARAIWSSLKEAICTFSPQETSFLLASKSPNDTRTQENEVAEAASICLERIMVQLDCLSDSSFINFIVEDEDMETIFRSVTSILNYKDLTAEGKQTLHALGNILSVSAKVSNSSCNRVFQSFFTRLMEILGIPLRSLSVDCISNDSHILSEGLNFGALYLCVNLLIACRDLTVGFKEFTPDSPEVEDLWCRLLQNFSVPLACALGSTLLISRSRVIEVAYIYSAVKGLQTLAMFPGSSMLISKVMYEKVLTVFVSIITGRCEEKVLWKLALKSLMQIGTFIERSNDSEKQTGYMNIVVEGILSLLLLEDSEMPLPLKLEALSGIGTTGRDYMMRVIQEFEKAISCHFMKASVEGNLKSAEILIYMLECYSGQVLPWLSKTEGFEEVALHFAVNVWNQLGSSTTLNISNRGQGLLDATMTAMRLAVVDCTQESQALIIQKAYYVLSSMILSPLKESVPFATINLESLNLTQDIVSLSCRDEWLISLFSSVLIALRPQTPIPELREILKLFTIFILKGCVPAAQALASVVNKCPLKVNTVETSSACTLEEALDIILETGLQSVLSKYPLRKCSGIDEGGENVSNLCSVTGRNILFEIHAIVGLAWIGKGLIMRGHEKVKEITMLILKCLLSSSNKEMMLQQNTLANSNKQDKDISVMRSAADGFCILLSDSEVCLNRKFHATIRPLYKQHFFSRMMPVLLSSVTECDSLMTRALLYRAFGHLISETPLVAIITEAKKLLSPLLNALTMLSKDILNKDVTYSLLLVLSGILMDENGKEAVIESAHTIITNLLALTSYPHMALVRETAIQCLVAMIGLPHVRIFPMRTQVLQAIAKALDDPKRSVRQEAVRCRQAWASIASRSLHF